METENETLREIFLQSPVIAFKANPSLRHKLVRAKLKSLDDPPQPIPHQPNDELKELPDQFPHTIFKNTFQNFKNPVKQCINKCLVCQTLDTLDTKCYAVSSTTLNHKFPINFPKSTHHFNCKTTNVIYLITCETPGCRSQYMGYTTRQLKFRVYEHQAHNSSPVRLYKSAYLPSEFRTSQPRLYVLIRLQKSSNPGCNCMPALNLHTPLKSFFDRFC